MKYILTFLSIIILFSVTVNAQEKNDNKVERDAIVKTIEDGYRDGLGNLGDVELAKKNFHPGFNILGLNQKNNALWKYPIYSWIENVERNKVNDKYPPAEEITFEFPMIDITGNAAVAKVAYFEGGKQIYVDYLSLYKFKEGWKIVNKIFYALPTEEK